MKQSLIRILAALLLVSAGFALNFTAVSFPDFITARYIPFSRAVMTVISKITGLFPFSVAELLLYIIVVCTVVGIIITVYLIIRKKRRRLHIALKSLSIYMLTVGAAVFIFYLTWGLSYSQTPLAAQMALDVHPRTAAELKDLCVRLTDVMNRIRPQVQDADFRDMAKETAKNFNLYTNRNYPPVKPVLMSEQMSYLGLTGIFIPFTSEANVNHNNFFYAVPFVMAHEMAHRHGVAREDEANFYAYVVCSNASDSPLLQYSAAFMAFEYSIGRLYSADKDAWREVYSKMDDTVLTDIAEYAKHWEKYESKASTTMNNINNTYLKAQGQSDGVKSYGRMVDLLLAYTAQQNDE